MARMTRNADYIYEGTDESGEYVEVDGYTVGQQVTLLQAATLGDRYEGVDITYAELHEMSERIQEIADAVTDTGYWTNFGGDH